MLDGRTEGKRPIRRKRHRWMDTIKMHLRRIRWDGMDWTDFPHWRALVNTVMNLRVPKNVWKFLSGRTTDAPQEGIISTQSEK
jgi:hypothetical protein